jgi:hypothetical protein
MYLKDFLANQPTGYLANIADVTGTTYSKMGSMSHKLKIGKKLNAHEVTIFMKGISILEGKEYNVYDFTF